MNRFPLCINLEDKCFLVVGYGRIAKRKLKAISEFTSNIKIITKELTEEEPSKGIEIVNKRITVNEADARVECEFFPPGIIKRGNLVVSVSTSGKSPAYSRYLREQIEDMIPDNIEKVLDIL